MFFYIVIIGLSAHIVSAASGFGGGFQAFGGRITNTKALNIQTIEESNYTCAVYGSSITIEPVGKGSETNFLIPATIKSSTNTYARSGQWILGLFNMSPTTVTCTFRGTPPNVQTTQISPITLYGTSR